MLKNSIDALIAEAMKSKNDKRVNTLRLIKSELVKKEKDGKELNGAMEATILLKMMAQREDSINQFKKANRMDLVENEEIELNIIKEFAPKQATDDEIIAETEIVSSKIENLSMKDMKFVLSEVQKKYPTANGKLISEYIKSKITK